MAEVVWHNLCVLLYCVEKSQSALVPGGCPLGARFGRSLGRYRLNRSRLLDLTRSRRDVAVFSFTEMRLVNVATHSDDPRGTWYLELNRIGGSCQRLDRRQGGSAPVGEYDRGDLFYRR